MERKEILKQVNDIFIDILDNNQIVLNEKTTVLDVEEWDSLTHIQLIVAIEKHFHIKFTTKETQSWNDIGEFLDSINKYLLNLND